MALKNLFKLEKLKIKAYKSCNRSTTDLVGTFEAMFNPTSFQQKYAIRYGRKQVNYTYNEPPDLSLKLLLDGTGVHEMGILRLRQKKVSERVEEFLKLTFRMNGNIHEPNYLVVEWGDLIFSCRLGSVDISYTSFDRDGTALRAELDVNLIADEEVRKRLRKENKTSPDLTHSRIVKSGDTLPLLSKEIYGDASYYLRLAQANNLDDFRNLQAGQEIFFPPLAP
jgi:Contractile injection system tube protein/LysM domain